LAFLPARRLLLLFGLGFSGRSGSSAFSGLGSVSGRSSSAFSGLGSVSGRSGGRSFSGLHFSGGSSGGRSFNGLRLFLLAAGGHSECNESSNQERLFHCWFPLSINEVRQLNLGGNQVGDLIY